MLLLPGLDGTGRLFDDFVRALPPNVEAHVISYPTARPLGYTELVEYVAAHTPAGPYAVVAESFSGPVALALGAQKPAGLRGIVLCNSFIVPPAPRWLRMLPLRAMFHLGVPKALLRHFLVGAHHESVVRDLVGAIRSVPAPILASRVRSVLACNAAAALAACSVPVVFAYGSRDRVVRGHSVHATSGNSKCDQVMLDGPHLLLQTRPREAAQIIGGYVQRWCAS